MLDSLRFCHLSQIMTNTKAKKPIQAIDTSLGALRLDLGDMTGLQL